MGDPSPGRFSPAPMGAAAERLLWLMVVTKTPVTDYSLDLLTEIAEQKKPQAARLRLRVERKGWRAAPAPAAG